MLFVDFTRILGVLMVLGSLPAVYLVRILWNIRYNVSVMWFVLSVGSFSLWVFTLGTTLLVPSDQVVAGLLYFARIAGIVTTLSIFLFILEYTIGKAIGWRTIVPFLLVPATTVGVLLVSPESFMTVQFDDRPYTLIFNRFGFVHVGYSLLLHVMSLTLLFRSYLVTSGKQRKQVILILAWYVLAIVTVFVPVFSSVPNYANPGIFGLLLLLIATTYSLRKFGLFTVNPQYKTHMFDEIGESVVILNAVGTVIDFNLPAKDLFDFDGRHFGRSATSVFAEYPDLKELIEGEERKRTITQQTENDEKYFAATTSSFSYGRTLSGTILVLRDITPIESREKELDILRQVFSRVFRHNMRNELNVIRGRIQNIKSGIGDDPVQEIQAADRSVERLLEHSNKARQIEKLVSDEYENRPQSLSKLVSDAVSDCRERYPDATIVNTVDDVSVTAISAFGTAIENGIENSVEHNPDSVVIELSSEVDDDTVTLVIEDDGVGIAGGEIKPLREEQETDLSHSSGVGLWLMKWYVEKSNGKFDIERTESGTRVEMRLNRS